MRFLASIILIAISVKTCDCSKEGRTFGRIVRGHDAARYQFPYFALMDYQRETATTTTIYMCGAALIDKNWLLTAAHCLHGIISVKVYLGVTDKRAQKIFNVSLSDIRIHPSFSTDTFSHDIALVKIPPTELSKEIAIVPLPKEKRTNDGYGMAHAIACGWGHTSSNGRFPSSLQYGRLQILHEKDCLRMPIPNVKNNSRNIICTAVRSDLASICAGDSGGPLVLESTGELVGIASLADRKNCENGFTPVFTRVVSYMDWIQTVSGISN